MAQTEFSEACSLLAMPLKWLGLINDIFRHWRTFCPLGEELNHIKAVFITLVRSKTWKDVEQWVSWQQGNCGCSLGSEKWEALINCLSLSCVLGWPNETCWAASAAQDEGDGQHYTRTVARRRKEPKEAFIHSQMKLSSHRRKLSVTTVCLNVKDQSAVLVSVIAW